MNWPQGGRRWLAVGLLASLTLNAFFIGATATDVLRSGDARGDHRRGGVLRYELRWLAERLPPEAIAAIEAAIDAGRPEAQRHIDRLRQLRVDYGNLVAAADPDRAAIETKLEEIRGELDTMVGTAQTATTDAILALPPDIRARLSSN